MSSPNPELNQQNASPCAYMKAVLLISAIYAMLIASSRLSVIL